MAEVRLSGLVRSYDGRARAVDGVSLDVADGEVLAVLGPSGCGKSTLLRLVAGLERPDAGEVFIGGRRMNDVEPRDRDVAMVFQSYALYPHLTAFENIAVPLRLRGAAGVRERVEAAAARLGLSGLLGRMPKDLSGGERQRVALARALVREPKAFLLDEPLSNLDAQLRERARAELKALFKQARATAIYVTHDQAEAMALSDRVAVMRAGRLEQVAAPEELYARPATVFVAGFVGTPRMNLLPGSVLGGGAHTVGIRPEDVRVGEGPLEMSVVLREPLGAQAILTLRGGDLELRALVSPSAPVSGAVRVAIDPAKAHFFDQEGRRRE
jgi:multiple sugar transport system ATP-binding protein